MSAPAVSAPKIEGHNWPRTDFEEGGRYLGIPRSGSSPRLSLLTVQETGCGT
jgi:hypothetical protein